MNNILKVYILIGALVIVVVAVKYIGTHPGKTKIMRLINSSGACDRIKGFMALGQLRDTSLYYLFFENMRDRNIAHCLTYLGKSVLWAKIEMLRRITRIEPELPYDPMEPDIRILEQYKRILHK